MAEIILPPEENEETPQIPQVPELNIDKPTENSKVITIEFEAKKTKKVSTKGTNQQLYTTDTDAWFEFKETSLESASGTYSVVFRNRHDGSVFQRTGDVVNGVAYYKIPHQEIRHAGPWRGQVVYTLSNGDTTAREFDYDVKGHILDGKDVREIVVEDFETLMSQLRSMKDNAELELAGLVSTANQNETDRQVFFDDLVEDIDELQANYQELLDTGVLQTNINNKLEQLEEEYAPKLTEVTAQLDQKVNHGKATLSDFDEPTRAVLQGLEPGQINAVLGEKNVHPENTSFLINTANENLFDGVYMKDRNINNGHYGRVNDGRVAIVPIGANKTYTVKKHSPSDRFRLGTLVEHPGTAYPIGLEQMLVTSDTLTQYTFTNSETARFLIVHVSSTGIEPKLKVEEGSVATEFGGAYQLSSDIKVNYPSIEIEDLDFIEPVETNIFNGDYISDVGLFTVGHEVEYLATLTNARTAIVEIEPNTSYTVTRHDTSNRFRLATFNEYPDYSNGSVYVETSINHDDDLSSVSFSTTAESRYLAVTVSRNKEEPRLKIEKGIVSTPLETYKFIDNILVDSEKPIERHRLVDAEKMNMLDLIELSDIQKLRKPDFHIGEKNVHPENTSFLINTANENLFDGVYMKDRNINNGHYGRVNDGRVAIVPIGANKTYTVKKHSPSDRFRLGTLVEHPGTAYPIGLEQMLVTSDTLTQYTFTNSETARFLIVHVSSTGIEPKLKVEEGSVATEFGGAYQLSSDIKVNYPSIEIEDLDFIEPVETNIFNGDYISDVGLFTVGHEVEYLATLTNARTAIVEIEPNTSYTVTRHDTSNRFRLATFNEYPDYSNGSVYVETSINHDDDLSSVSFSTTAESRYLAVTVSRNKEEPRLKIEKGIVSTPLETYKFIDNILVDSEKPIERHRLVDAEKMNMLDLIELSDIQKLRKPDFHILDVFEGLYNAPNEEQFSDLSEIENIKDHTIIYDMMDELVADFPEFLTMTVIGYDSLGNEIRAYDSNLPYLKRGTGGVISSRLPYDKKIAITGGIHGNEKKSVTSLVRVIREIFYNPRNDINLDILKWNISFTVVPIVSPDCYNRSSRLNSNGVNLNRNFDASFVVTSESGPTPASESETKAIQNWMNNWENVYYYIDYHTISGDRPMGYVYDRDSATLLNSLFRSLTYKWKKDYPDVNTVYDLYGYITTEITNGDTTLYARNLGVPGITFEFADNSIFFGGSKNDIVNRRSSMEFLGNMLILLAKGR